MPLRIQGSCGVWREDSVLLSMPGRKQVPHLVMTGAFHDGPSGSKEGKTAEGGDIFVELVEAGLSDRKSVV